MNIAEFRNLALYAANRLDSEGLSGTAAPLRKMLEHSYQNNKFTEMMHEDTTNLLSEARGLQSI